MNDCSNNDSINSTSINVQSEVVSGIKRHLLDPSTTTTTIGAEEVVSMAADTRITT